MSRQWYIAKNMRGAQKLTTSELDAHKHAGTYGGVRELRHNPSTDTEGYAVVNGLGALEFFSTSENEAVNQAVTLAGSKGVVAMDDQSSVPLTKNPESIEGIRGAPTAQQAYKDSGLPEVLRKRGYLHGYLTRQDVEKWTPEAAWARIRSKLPTGEELAEKAAQQGKKRKTTTANAWQKSATTCINALLKQNAKTAKSLQESRAGQPAEVFVSVGLSLAPHQLAFRGIVYDAQGRPDYANLDATVMDVNVPSLEPGKYTLCAGSSQECRQTCLAYSGHNPLNDSSYITKIKLTEALYEEPAAFMRLLIEAIRKHFWKYAQKSTYKATKQGVAAGIETENVDDETNEIDEAEELGLAKNPAAGDTVEVPAIYYPRVRLNVYQDIPWEVLCPDLLDSDWLNAKPLGARGTRPAGRPLGIMYDYTKVLRQPTDTLDITFSSTGTDANMRACEEMLKRKINAAVVFVGASGDKLTPAATGGRALKQFSYATEVDGSTVKLYPWKLRFFVDGTEWAVLNGDESDIRDQDPKGYVVGLTYKVPRVRYQVSDAVYAKRVEEHTRAMARWTKRAAEAFAAGVPMEKMPKMPAEPSHYGYQPAVDAEAVNKFVVRVRVIDVEKDGKKIKALMTTHNPNQSHVLIA